MTSVNLDLIGRKEYMCFLLECDGIKDGSYMSKREWQLKHISLLILRAL